MGDLIWFFNPYFDSERSYQAYLRAEEAVNKEPLEVGFDWRLFLAIMFGRYE